MLQPDSAANTLFLIAAGLLIWTYTGYPLCIHLLGRLMRRRVSIDPAWEPTVSLIIPAYNEERVIGQKIANALKQDYPSAKLQIVMASDCSTDRTVAIARSNPGVEVADFQQREGKMATVVKAVAGSDAEIIVLTDANALYAPDTVRRLVAPLSDPAVGCVCGSKNIVADITAPLTTGMEEQKYWRFENFIKTAETLTGSCLGADGSVYAVRRALFPAPPPGRLIMDDMFVSLAIALKGSRCVFEPRARAYEGSDTDSQREFRRKARILAGALTVVQFLPRLWFSSLTFKFLSHKVLRWLTAPLLLLALLTNAVLLHQGGPWPVLFALQTGFYLAALTGAFLDRQKIACPPFKQCYYFLLTATAQIHGFVLYLRMRKTAHWEKLRTDAAQT